MQWAKGLGDSDLNLYSSVDACQIIFGQSHSTQFTSQGGGCEDKIEERRMIL